MTDLSPNKGSHQGKAGVGIWPNDEDGICASILVMVLEGRMV